MGKKVGGLVQTGPAATRKTPQGKRGEEGEKAGVGGFACYFGCGGRAQKRLERLLKTEP